jgi:hypothetical protein
MAWVVLAGLLLVLTARAAEEEQREVVGARVVCGPPGRPVPILDEDGVQVKRILAGTVDVLGEGERPEVLHEGKDFRLELEAGLFVPLPGGRCEQGGQVSLSCRHRRTPPRRQETPVGPLWTLDGDDCVPLPGAPTVTSPATLTVRLAVTLAADCSPDAVLLSRGPAMALRLVGGQLAVEHRGLRDAQGQPASLTVTESVLRPGVRTELLLTWQAGTLTLARDGQTIAQRTGLQGTWPGSGPWRVSGPHDPLCFRGQLQLLALEAAR